MGGLDNVGKEHFVSLHKAAREQALIMRKITSGWAATGLSPINPEKFFRDIPKPPTQLTISDANGLPADSCQRQREMLAMPMIPVRPVSSEVLSSLHNMNKEDTCQLDELSQRRLLTRVQKLATSAQISFADRTFSDDQNRFLSNINKEA